MEEEGKLIDGYLSYLKDDKNPGELNNYVYNQIFKNDDTNRSEQIKVINLIQSRVEQYHLASKNENNPKRQIISGIGRDVLAMGGYNEWKAFEEAREKRKEKREDGTYQINRYLFYTSIFGLIFTITFSLYQAYTNNQTNTELELLKQRVSKIETQLRSQTTSKEKRH